MQKKSCFNDLARSQRGASAVEYVILLLVIFFSISILAETGRTLPGPLMEVALEMGGGSTSSLGAAGLTHGNPNSNTGSK